MDIKYQILLNNNPVIPSKYSDYVFELEPLSISEIVILEAAYNQGNQFPLALRELLFLAGTYCYVLDYGVFDTQLEIQERSRALLVRRNIEINRPFFVIDVHEFGQQFLYVYLDEGVDDPNVQEIYFGSDTPSELGFSLTTYINLGIKELLKRK